MIFCDATIVQHYLLTRQIASITVPFHIQELSRLCAELRHENGCTMHMPHQIAGYDGWGHDASRTWRKRDRLESEGFKNFGSKYDTKAFALHHRFYFHHDARGQLWLSAEDGCEGVVAMAPLKKRILNDVFCNE